MNSKSDAKSPCHICPLKQQDKNSDECINCKKRVDYVESIGDNRSSVPIEKTHLGRQRKMDTEQIEVIEEIIKEICSEEGVSVASINEGKFHGAYTKARRRIAYKLKKEYDLTPTQIARLTGVGAWAIISLLKPKGKKNTRKRAPKFDTVPPVPEPAKEKKSKDPEYKISLNFTGYSGLYKKLVEKSKLDFRTIEGQILFYIDNGVTDIAIKGL